VRRVAGVLLLVFVASAAVGAAQDAPPERAQESAAPKVMLRADQQQIIDETIVRYTGDVVLTYQDITIRCAELEFDNESMELVARGGVVMDRGPSRFTCSELRYNLRSKSGMFIDAAGDIEPFYSFTAATLERLDETNYRLEDASFTSCEPGPRPPWTFDMRSADLEQDAYGRFRGVALRVKGVPVLYLPYLVWPLKQERSPGLLMPGFGYSDRYGYYLGNAVYIPLGRSWDTTAYLDYFSEGYYGLGSEWRWAPAAGARGEVYLYTIWDPVAETWQWKYNGRHEQDDLFGFRLLSEIEGLSDVDFFQEFERDFDANTRRSLYSYLYLTRTRGPYALNLRADHRTTFLEPDDVILSQLPEVELRVRSTRLGSSSLYWSMISSVNVFDVDRGGDLEALYGRIDVFPEISYTVPGPPWLSVTPRFGARGTYYTQRLADDRRSYVDDPIDRSYVEAGLDFVGPSFSRVFDRPMGPYSRFKHLIEPRVEYSFVSDVDDQQLIPTFDEVDSVLVINKVRVTLANRLFGRSKEGVSAQELGSFELFQEYSFDEDLNRGDGERTSKFGPLGAALRLTPAPGLTFDARASYDTLFDNLVSASVSAGVYRGWLQANLTWYESYLPVSGERASSQIRTILGFRQKGFPLRAQVQLSYNAELGELQQQQYQLHYEGSCWGVSVEYRDLQLGTFPTEDWRLVISLKGIGALPEIKGTIGPGR
jgi:LPS-assembly protein